MAINYYEAYLELGKKGINKIKPKNGNLFFTPFTSIEDTLGSVAAPIVAPLSLGVVAILDALTAAFLAAEGTGYALCLENDTATEKFRASGVYSAGFVLAAISACYAPVLATIQLATRTYTTCCEDNTEYFNKRNRTGYESVLVPLSFSFDM